MQAEKLDLDGLTKGLATKSDKIRELGRCGVPTAEIARYLGIRYQHARNVLVAAGLHAPGEAGGPVQDGPTRATPVMPAKASIFKRTARSKKTWIPGLRRNDDRERRLRKEPARDRRISLTVAART